MIAVGQNGSRVRESLPEVLRRAEIPVLVLADVSSVDAIDLMKSGVADVVLPPPTPAGLVPRLWRLIRRSPGNEFRRQLKQNLGLARLIGEAPQFLAEVRKAPLAAQCDVTVIITGETGVGKELFARAVHYLSPRAGGPFNPVNCGAIPYDLVENELFGHVAGAFTGASSNHPGLIEESEGGTLFLDEIDCLSPLAQVKLLRLLQEKEYRPLGSARTRSADVRVITAMNTPPEKAIADGRLRRDLFYRINVFPLNLPPLRERLQDIPLLARHFLGRYCAEYKKTITAFAPEAIALLVEYDWPGNVRELEHVVQRAVVLSSGERIESADILIAGARSDSRVLSLREQKAHLIAQFEVNYLQRLLAAHQGNVSRAAQAARKNRRAFFELLRKHNIDAEQFRQPRISF